HLPSNRNRKMDRAEPPSKTYRARDSPEAQRDSPWEQRERNASADSSRFHCKARRVARGFVATAEHKRRAETVPHAVSVGAPLRFRREGHATPCRHETPAGAPSDAGTGFPRKN